MALWKARGRASLNKNLEFRSWHCGRQGGGRKWVGWGAQVSIGGASDRFEAQVIRRRNLLKNFSSRFKPFSSTFRTLLKPPSNLSEAPLKPSEALLKPPPSCQNPSSPWSPLQSPSQAPEALLKPPSSPLEASFTLKPHWSPSQAPLKPPWSPSQAPLKPPWSPSQAPFKPPSKPSPSSPLQALLKPPWSPLKALLKPPWSSLEAPLKAPLKPFSSPLEAPFKPLKASQRWSPLQAPFQAFWRWRVLFVLVFGSFLGNPVPAWYILLWWMADCTCTWYRTQTVAWRRSERHPGNSCQESARRWAKHKESSSPRMQVLKSYGQPMWVHHPRSAYSRPHPHTKKQGHSRASSWLSPARRSPPSHLLRPDFWITALLVHASRPMASGQDHHGHGETEPVGLQVADSTLLMNMPGKRSDCPHARCFVSLEASGVSSLEVWWHHRLRW